MDEGKIEYNVKFDCSELIKVFEELGNSMKEFADEFNGYSKAMTKMTLQRAVASLYTEAECYVQATFLTRW